MENYVENDSVYCILYIRNAVFRISLNGQVWIEFEYVDIKQKTWKNVISRECRESMQLAGKCVWCC